MKIETVRSRLAAGDRLYTQLTGEGPAAWMEAPYAVVPWRHVAQLRQERAVTSMGDTLLPGATQPQTLVTPVSARMHQIGAVLGAGRVDPTRELPCHDQIAQILTDANVTFEREHRLAARERIDFMAGSIGIEVKVKGAARTTLRQLERYCAHDAVEGIILLTNKAMSLPKTIKGKPAIVVSIGAAWL